MKKPICSRSLTLRCRTFVSLPALLLLLLGTPARATVHVLRFIAGGANAVISGNGVILDSPLLNGKPSAKPIITQYFAGVFNNHPVGMYFVRNTTTPAFSHWDILNEDGADMPAGAIFNVLISTSTAKVDATPLNSFSRFTAIPTAKGKIAANLLFTHWINPYPKTSMGITLGNQGLTYPASTDPLNPLFNQWCVFNQNLNTQAFATSYFVLDTATDPKTAAAVAFRHTSTAANVKLDYTTLDDATALNASTAVVFSVPFSGDSDKVQGVFFSGTSWGVFNEDQSNFSTAQQNNVVMFPALIP